MSYVTEAYSPIPLDAPLTPGEIYSQLKSVNKQFQIVSQILQYPCDQQTLFLMERQVQLLSLQQEILFNELRRC
jgi:hypothetical protein